VGSDLVVLNAPGFDQHDRFLLGSKPFEVEALIAQRSVEAFVGSVLR
jgi:hypothetical protein